MYPVGLFGVKTQAEESTVILIPVPWDLTTSYGGGTARGPETILQASPQLDLFDRDFPKARQASYHLLPIPDHLLKLNDRLRPHVMAIRDYFATDEDGVLPPDLAKLAEEVNQACDGMCTWVYTQAREWLGKGKIVASVGGDHSTPFGLIRALAEKHKSQFGILHVDAHADLRQGYQSFRHSHASIMYNVMNASWRPTRLVQVGIRDFCQAEFEMIEARSDITTFFDSDLKAQTFAGQSWQQVVRPIVEALPEKVYVSFDIDGLEPTFCPSTGTPVPGGLTFDAAVYLLKAVLASGRQVVGFDLNEVAPASEPGNEWDGNVGARLLYKLCGMAASSSKAGG
ncbi:MAG: agmatinase family protein [Bdellovibrionales bacterium]